MRIARRLRPDWARRHARLQRFQHVLLAATEMAAINKLALPTLVRSIALPLQARRLTKALESHEHGARVSADFDNLFFPTHRPISADGQSLNDLLRQRTDALSRTYFRLRLGKDVVLPWAWNRRRLINTLGTIGGSKSGGAWRGDINHRVQLLLPFGVGLVHGGNHSLVAGIVDGEGEVIADALDLSVAYEHVVFDGIAFRRKHDGMVLNIPEEEEPGVLFEIGRHMLELGVQYDASTISSREREDALSQDRLEILYQVWMDGRDTGMSVRPGAIQVAMQRVGIRRTDREWDAILFCGDSFSPNGNDTYMFKPYGPRPLAADILEARNWSRR